MLSESRLYWLVQRSKDVPTEHDWLSAAERAKLSSFKVDKRRADWRLGRWTAKVALSAHFAATGEPTAGLDEIELRPAADGAPDVYVRNKAAAVDISLSHSGQRGFCVIDPARQRIGCDVERIEQRTSAFTSDYFTAAEQEYIAAIGSESQTLMTTLIWSAKESALKALREGLRLDTRTVEASVETNPGSGFWNRLTVHISQENLILKGWWAEVEDCVQTIVSGATSAVLEECKISVGDLKEARISDG